MKIGQSVRKVNKITPSRETYFCVSFCLHNGQVLVISFQKFTVFQAINGLQWHIKRLQRLICGYFATELPMNECFMVCLPYKVGLYFLDEYVQNQLIYSIILFYSISMFKNNLKP